MATQTEFVITDHVTLPATTFDKPTNLGREMDPLSATLVSALASSLASDTWSNAVARLRARTHAQTEEHVSTVPVVVEPEGTPSPTQAALSNLLEEYYAKVGRRADVSFFAAITASVLGYVIIAAGIMVGIYRSDDLALAVVVSAAGLFSQVLGFFFFRNRAEERKAMIQVLGDLRQDAERNVRATRALDLVEQVQQPLLRDNLAAAIALELSGASADLKNIHDALKLFDTGNNQPQSDAA